MRHFQSFSELFVSFLERESSPRPQVRLPTDQMVKEQQQKKLGAHQKARTTFNPFAVPAHGPSGPSGSVLTGGMGGGGSLLTGAGRSGQNILTDPGGGSGTSHLLMSSPARPSFSPVTVVAQESPPPGSVKSTGVASGSSSVVPGGSGRASANSSGRTTPAAATNVVRGVLHN